jgi:hypothetical protein
MQRSQAAKPRQRTGAVMAKKPTRRAGKKAKRKTPRRTPEPQVPAIPRDPALPLWTPAGIEASRVPAEEQQAAREIV